jgi:hypothetical protein
MRGEHEWDEPGRSSPPTTTSLSRNDHPTGIFAETSCSWLKGSLVEIATQASSVQNGAEKHVADVVHDEGSP